jgi:hypothetical protein
MKLRLTLLYATVFLALVAGFAFICWRLYGHDLDFHIDSHLGHHVEHFSNDFRLLSAIVSGVACGILFTRLLASAWRRRGAPRDSR